MSILALASFGAVLALVLRQHWQVPPVALASSASFSAERVRNVLGELVDCGPKHVGFSERCGLEVLQAEVQRIITEEKGAATVDVQSASGHFYLDFIGGLTIIYRNLSNLVVKVPGRSPPADSCSLLISSHFDSALGSPAASDANAEMAIMTDLLRLLLREPLEVDVIFNFNGGEEVLMPAAHGFVTRHPWAASICAQINLEAAGSGGRELLFQAGPANRWIAEIYKKHVHRPHGSSITQAFFDTGLIPGETDFRIYRDFGQIPGADFAVLTNGWVYHTWQDNMAHLDFRSLQRYGDTVYQFARGIAQKLQGGRPEGSEAREAAVYFDVGGVFFVEYPASWAQKLHVAVALLVLTSFHRSLVTALRLLVAAVACLVCCTLIGLALAYTAGMAVAGHPELGVLLYAPGLAAFRGSLPSVDLEHGSVTLAALLCLALSASSTTVMASYPFFVWTLLPALGLFVSKFLPVAPLLNVVTRVLPWMLLLQMLVLGVDFLGPLTFRSGTTVPGDVLLGAFYGLMLALLLSVSAPFLARLRRRDVLVTSAIVFLLGWCLAVQVFPYSQDRQKRIFQQHVRRSEAWHGDEVRWKDLEHGLWTIAMDWNNVATLKLAPFGFPEASVYHDDEQGIYGRVPMPFPMKAFLVGGLWSPRAAPSLPSRNITVELQAAAEGPLRKLQVRARGPPQMMMVLSPASKVQRWSLGRSETSADRGDTDRSMPHRLPPIRRDCDCFFLLYAEGGDASHGAEEAFNFSLLAAPGEMHLDIWALHLETQSAELKAEESRQPSWVNYFGWVSELQVHHIVL